MFLTSVTCDCSFYNPDTIINSLDIQKFTKPKKYLCETYTGKELHTTLKILLNLVKLAEEQNPFDKHYMDISKHYQYSRESGHTSLWIILTNYRSVMDITPYWL
jgi:hypothetical protein